MLRCAATNKRGRFRLLGQLWSGVRAPLGALLRCCSLGLLFKSACLLLFSFLILMTVASFVLAIYTAVHSSHMPPDYDDADYDQSAEQRQLALALPYPHHGLLPGSGGVGGPRRPHAQPYGDTDEAGQEERRELDAADDLEVSSLPRKSLPSGPELPPTLNFSAAVPSSETSEVAQTGPEWWEHVLSGHRTAFERQAANSRRQCRRRTGVRSNVLDKLRFTPLTAGGQQCAAAEVFLLIVVHSKASHVERRSLIRATFGSMENLRGRKVRLLFSLGMVHPSEVRLKKQLHLEAERHGDLVQGNFREHNRNLSLNFHLLLRWIGRHCPHVDYVVKLDDDTFLDVGHLVDFLVYMPRRRFLYCAVARNRSPVRYAWSKWFVSRADYPLKKFPNYCLGVGFVLSGDLVPRVFGCSLAAKLLPVDDVFYTGQVMRLLGQGHSAFWEGHTYAWLTPRLLQACDRKNYIFLASKQSVVLTMLWKKLWKTVLIESLNSWSLL